MGSDVEEEEEEDDEEEKPLSKEELLAKYIEENVRGGKSTFKGPFGRKEVIQNVLTNRKCSTHVYFVPFSSSCFVILFITVARSHF